MGGARERERKGWNPVVSRSKRATPATTTTVQIRLGYIMDERERESSFRATSKTRIFFFSKVTLFILHKFFCQGEMEKNGRISPPVCAVVERKKKTDARDFFAGFLIRLCVCTTIFCVFERERSTCLFLGCPYLHGPGRWWIDCRCNDALVTYNKSKRNGRLLPRFVPQLQRPQTFFFQKVNFFNSFTTMLQTSCITVQPQVKKENNLTSSKKRRMF